MLIPYWADNVVTTENLEIHVKKFRKELNSGTSALILLAILGKSERPLYGYEITKLLESHSVEKQGAIYPVLRNMVAKELLEVEVIPSESGPPRKYFSISKHGREVLNEWARVWEETRSFVDLSLSTEPLRSEQEDE